jgi:hypothetical protein
LNTYADAGLAVGEAFHRKVLPELPEWEIASLQFALPIVIGIHLVDEHGAVFSPVTGEITLRVAIDVEPPDQAPSLHRILPHGRVDGHAAPRDLAGLAHVD